MPGRDASGLLAFQTCVVTQHKVCLAEPRLCFPVIRLTWISPRHRLHAYLQFQDFRTHQMTETSSRHFEALDRAQRAMLAHVTQGISPYALWAA